MDTPGFERSHVTERRNARRRQCDSDDGNCKYEKTVLHVRWNGAWLSILGACRQSKQWVVSVSIGLTRTARREINEECCWIGEYLRGRFVGAVFLATRRRNVFPYSPLWQRSRVCALYDLCVMEIDPLASLACRCALSGTVSVGRVWNIDIRSQQGVPSTREHYANKMLVVGGPIAFLPVTLSELAADMPI